MRNTAAFVSLIVAETFLFTRYT